MTFRRFLALAVVTAAACTSALASPAPAHAHGDPLHQHGWSAVTLMFSPDPARCFTAPLYNGSGTMSVAVPDFMTTPGGYQYVAFRAQLEYLDGSTWRNVWRDGSVWRPMPYTNWSYTLANASGIAWAAWLDYTTGKFGPRGTIGFDIYPGFTYRVHLYYYWFYDRYTDHEVTTTCTVPRLVGAKSAKAKKAKPASGKRARAVGRTPGTVPATVPVRG